LSKELLEPSVQFPRLGSTSALEKELAQLREENERLRGSTELAWFPDHPLPAFMVSAKTGKILDVNTAALKLYRYERQELLEQSLEMLRAAGSGSFSRWNLASSAGQRAPWNVKQLRRDGTVFTAEMHVTPMTYRGLTAELVQILDISRNLDAEISVRNIERRYHWLMDHATESMWRFELEVPIPIGLPVEEQIERCYRYGYLAEASRSTAEMYGYPSSQAMLGLRLENLIPRNDSNLAYIRHFVESGYRLLDAESEESDAQGRSKWFRNRLVGEVEGGLLVRAWGSSIDITQHKKMQEYQRQSNQLWHDALDNMHLLAMFLDSEGCITYINPFFSRTTGFTRNEVLGKSLLTVFDSKDAVASQQFLRILKSHSARTYCTNNIQNKSGERLILHWNNTLILDADGNSAGVFCLGEDVTEQQRTTTALQESEARYRRLVDGLPVGIYRSTPSGQLTFANPVVLNLLNLTHDQAAAQLNLNSLSFGPTYERSEFLRRLEKEGMIYGLEYAWKHPLGHTLWVREHALAIRNEQGQVLCYEGTLEDITNERMAKQQASEQGEHYRILAELAPVGIVLTRLGIITHANPFLAHMLGYEQPDELIGKTILEMLHPAERNEVAANYFAAPVANGLLPIQERRVLRKDGKSVLVQAQIALVQVANERGSVMVLRDISAERHADQDRRRWQQRILEMQKLESLGLLAGGLAHDFNNQLTVILGHISLLQNQATLDETQLSLLKPIEQAARHSIDLCQQMLSFAGRGSILVQSINLTELIQKTASLLHIACGKKAVLHFELDSKLPPLQSEEAQLRQVLINLVSNAADALNQSNGTITIRTGIIQIDEKYPNAEVTLELPKGSYIFLDVEDTGSGMDVNTRRRIFEPFFTTKTHGRGLGLPAVLGIVRSHSGAIEVNSKLRHGTTFRVFFPNKPLEEPKLSDSLPHVELTNPPISVLVVDDEPSLRQIVSKVLGNRGWRVLEAEDGVQACQLLRDNEDDIGLAIIDLAMPGMDGVETLRQLWQINPSVPAIAMSSYGSVELEKRFAGFPLHGVLPKPFNPAALEAAVEHVLTATFRQSP
jgi:two-component system cell cycle sensor histidine kinase/response regulator CckA